MTASLLIAPLAALFATADPAAAQTQTVEVTGQASITKSGSEAAAKDAARYDAFRNAVEQVGGTMVTGMSVTDQNTLVSDKILARSQGYIRHWSYVGDAVVDGDGVTVKVKADVGVAELDKDLEAIKALIDMKGKPRVVLLIAEQSIGMSEPFAWWNKGQKEAKGDLVSVDLGAFENSFIDDIKNNGWVFIDHDAVEGKIKNHNAFTSDLSNSQAMEFGKLSEAQIAIVGRVVVTSPGPSDMAQGMMAASANVSLRAINCDNGEIVATVSETIGDITTLDVSAASAGQKAVRMAAAKVAERLQAKILERWQGELNGTARITMKVSGVPSYKALQDLEGALSSVRGVKGVEERNADGAEAELDLDVVGTARMLAKAIDAKSIKGKTVNVKHVSSNELDVAFGK
jgi:hypothetical protein